MAYVITSGCTKDELCVDACPVDCIHPKKDEPNFETVEQLYVDPAECIDCGACIPVCPTSSIHTLIRRHERRLLSLRVRSERLQA
jgi:ferredoxin